MHLELKAGIENAIASIAVHLILMCVFRTIEDISKTFLERLFIFHVT
jgi:hypothetical protein